MRGTTLDTGALIALEAGSRFMIALVTRAAATKTPIAIPAGVVAQAWRGGARQVPITRLLRSSIAEIVPLDYRMALAAGALCSRTGVSDVIDATVVLCARARGHAIVTSDPRDLELLDPAAELVSPKGVQH